ncbi:MAG: hypothetical protein AAGI89_09355 [Pseudomonadota bacterium]
MSLKRRIGIIGGAAMVVIAVPSSLAQQPDADALRACQEISDADERLRCFDDALAPTPEQPVPEAAVTPPVPAPQPQPAPREETATAVPIAPAPSASSPPPAPARTEQERIDAFGAEDLVREREEDALTELRAVVASHEETSTGKHVFTLENGQVWRQIGGDNRSLYIPRRRDGPLEVIIRPGAVGSHSLRLANSKRSIKVERVR